MRQNAKIIVVDDERQICQNVEKILAKGNYEVVKADSADDALAKMAEESFSLMISDIVMPGKNGLELLKLVKQQWPLTQAIMMTAYASTETAAKAIRLGASDYIPKPFTPDELRTIVEQSLIPTSDDVIVGRPEEGALDVEGTDPSTDPVEIDVDMPFDRSEVVKAAGEAYADSLGPSDMPLARMPAPETLVNFCSLGQMTCSIFEKLGTTCKAGVKTALCPQNEAKKRKALKSEPAFNAKELIGVDLPFKYDEVVSVTGPEYVQHLNRDGVSFVPYEELKKRMTEEMQAEAQSADVMMEHAEATDYQNILVIDDETSVNNNIRKILAKSGYEVDQAFTKTEALEKIKKGFYELVLLDLRIPGVQGLELLQAVRENLPETKVVIITGYASIETAKETARMGAVDYLSKPFTPDEIREATETAFEYAA